MIFEKEELIVTITAFDLRLGTDIGFSSHQLNYPGITLLDTANYP